MTGLHASRSAVCLLAGFATSLLSGQATAQNIKDKFNLILTIRDHSFPNEPRFETPYVRVYVTDDSSEPHVSDSDNILTRTPQGDFNGKTYVFRDEIGDGDQIRAYAHILVSALDSKDGQDYFPVDPRPLRTRLQAENLGSALEPEVRLDRREKLAEIYRAELNGILRSSQLDDASFRQAWAAALSAIEYDPRLDNYLLAVRVIRANLSVAGSTLVATPSTPDDLMALGGFSELSFEDRWAVYLDLLDTLSQAPELSRRYGSAGTVREAGIQLGTEMLDHIDFADSDQTALSVVKVYQILATLHAASNDCFSVTENAAEALRNAEAIEMSWAVQRRLFLEWGDCLERVSAFGDGRSIEEFVAEASTDDFVQDLWSAYRTAGARVESRLRFATSDADRRIADLLIIANRIEEGN